MGRLVPPQRGAAGPWDSRCGGYRAHSRERPAGLATPHHTRHVSRRSTRPLPLVRIGTRLLLAAPASTSSFNEPRHTIISRVTFCLRLSTDRKQPTLPYIASWLSTETAARPTRLAPWPCVARLSGLRVIHRRLVYASLPVVRSADRPARVALRFL